MSANTTQITEKEIKFDVENVIGQENKAIIENFQDGDVATSKVDQQKRMSMIEIPQRKRSNSVIVPMSSPLAGKMPMNIRAQKKTKGRVAAGAKMQLAVYEDEESWCDDPWCISGGNRRTTYSEYGPWGGGYGYYGPWRGGGYGGYGR